MHLFANLVTILALLFALGMIGFLIAAARVAILNALLEPQVDNEMLVISFVRPDATRPSAHRTSVRKLAFQREPVALAA